MAGNLLGPRSWYQYTTDGGTNYSYFTDDDLAAAVGATLSDDNPTLPRGIKPRGVNCQDAEGNKKFVIIPSTANTIWTTQGGQTITIDGTQFSVTSKRGERARIPNNATGGGP